MSTEQATQSERPALWNPNAAANWSLLLGPAFGAFLHARNWQALGEPRRGAASRDWFYSLLAVYAGLPILDVLVPDRKAHGAVRFIGLACLLTWYFSTGRDQPKFVKEKFGKDYPRKPWGKALGIGALAVLGFWTYWTLVGVIVGLVRG